MKVKDVMERGVTTMVEHDALEVARHVMLRHGIRHVPVVRAGHVVGLLSERDVLAHLSKVEGPESVEATVGHVMSTPVQTILPSAPVEDAAARMSAHKIGCLAVEQEGELVGIVTTTDLLASMARSLVEDLEPSGLNAGAIMSPKLGEITPDEPLLDAVAAMVLRGVQPLLVVDDLRRVVGRLSDHDVRVAVGDPLQALEDTELSDKLASMKVSDAMTQEPRTVRTDTSLASLIDALLADRSGGLPVVDEDDRLVGIVSYMDLLHCLRRQLANPKE
jgi:CBS domain-containing protein